MKQLLKHTIMLLVVVFLVFGGLALLGPILSGAKKDASLTTEINEPSSDYIARMGDTVMISVQVSCNETADCKNVVSRVVGSNDLQSPAVVQLGDILAGNGKIVSWSIKASKIGKSSVVIHTTADNSQPVQSQVSFSVNKELS